MVDLVSRKSMRSILEDILRGTLTGWQIHDRLDQLSAEDSAVDSICWFLETIYAGWEKRVTVLEQMDRQTLERCALYMTTQLEPLLPAASFLTKRRWWFRKFALRRFLETAHSGYWPFASRSEFDAHQVLSATHPS